MKGIEEGVHLLEILGWLLFQTVVFREEGAERRKHIEHGLDILPVAAEPEQITALVGADLLNDLLDNDLAARTEQSTQTGEAENVLT